MENLINPLVKNHIHKFYEKYINREFEQDDVTLFLIMSRDYMQNNRPLREISDFIAHPKFKDRGLTLKTIFNSSKKFDEYIESYKKGLNPKLTLESFSLEEISSELNLIFSLIEKKNNITKDDKIFKEFVFCFISMLSSYKIKIGFAYDEVTFDSAMATKKIIDYKEYEIELIYKYGLKAKINFSVQKFSMPNIAFNVDIPIIDLPNIYKSTELEYFKSNGFLLKNTYARRTNNKILYLSEDLNNIESVENDEYHFPCYYYENNI